MRAQDLSAVWKMCTKCGPKIVACLRDPQCKAALDCLQGCASNDQVCLQFGSRDHLGPVQVYVGCLQSRLMPKASDQVDQL